MASFVEVSVRVPRMRKWRLSSYRSERQGRAGIAFPLVRINSRVSLRKATGYGGRDRGMGLLCCRGLLANIRVFTEPRQAQRGMITGSG